MAQVHRPLLTTTTEQDNLELAERLRWVIGLRWSVVLALLLVGVATFLRSDIQDSLIYAGLGTFVFLCNLFYMRVFKQGDFSRPGPTRLARYGQVPTDLLVFTVLVQLSGGIASPVFVLYFLYIFVGLAILPPVGAYWVAGIAAALYAALALLEASGLLPSAGAITLDSNNYTGYVLVVAATLMITAYIANYFAGLLTRNQLTIRHQLDEMNVLYTGTRTMSSTLSSGDVMRSLLTLAAEIEAPDSCALLLFEGSDQVHCAASLGLGPEERRFYEEHPLTINSPLLQQLIAGGKGLYAPDVDAVPDLRPLLVRKSTHSMYSVPMFHDEKLTGVLNLTFGKPYTMPSSHWNLLSTLTQQAGVAIDRIRLFSEAESSATESERAAREMTGLYNIGLATTSSLQIDEVLRLIYEQVNRVLHPDTFYIGLYEDDLAELRFDIFVENGTFLPPFRVRLEGGVSGWVIRTRKPVFVRNWDAEIEQLPFEAGVVGAPTQSVISVPLMAKNKMVGVMSVQSLVPNSFDHDQLRLLSSIASQAALALENAKLHAQVNEQAQRDSLTGAYNHGTFIDKLHKLIRDANTNRHPVALVMLDIDRFKQYNDTYGHMVGDDVLRSIVAAIQDHLKGTDVVGRWGGEEFGIILPEVSRAQARLIAERIRQTAARAMLKDIHSRSIPSPTVSQGLAMFPDDATNIEELIDKADSALFRAKDLGRNQIAEWIDLEVDSGPVTFRARG